MEMTPKYLKENHRYIYNKYCKTHKVEKIAFDGDKGVDLRNLKDNESVIYGDGTTFYFKLTKLK